MEKRLKIVSEPQDSHQALLCAGPDAHAGFVFMWHTGDLNFICGSCGVILCRNIKEGQIRDVVLKCPRCGCYNQT